MTSGLTASTAESRRLRLELAQLTIRERNHIRVRPRLYRRSRSCGGANDREGKASPPAGSRRARCCARKVDFIMTGGEPYVPRSSILPRA